MKGARNFLGTSFGSAVTGGLVVAVIGLVAIETGLIDTGGDGGTTTVAAAPLTQPASDTTAKGNSVSQIYNQDGDGVVFIQSQITQKVSSPFNVGPQSQSSTATGSGFVIDGDGHILTNAHVVEGASQIRVQLAKDSEPLDAQVVGADTSSDVAVLKVEADSSDLHPLALGNSDDAAVGDPVVAIGNPFGLDRTVTSGIVSALQRQIQAPNGFSIDDVIQTDAAINPGNSGGPLIDSSGRVIGINSQIASQGGGSEGVGFAVPINTVRDVAQQLIDGGEVEHAYLGISGGDVTPDIAKALNLSVDHGAAVDQALNGGPAAEAGIHGATGQATIGGQTFPIGGDIITEVDGEQVEGMNNIIAKVESHKPGDEITVTVVRGGDTQEVQVKLGDRPANVAGTSSGR
ncbi:MAG: trypsin-like serine protease [Solirubrobacterales bacterium]|nr:trypsin-like serine protease [Solirubrobacterales bacterium]